MRSAAKSPTFLAKLLALLLPILLIIPNAMLCYTEEMGFLAAAANLLLPLGVYYLAVGITKRIGVSTLVLLPVMILAAFQIVLLYLYGGSIIAVDMFLNVVTTNATEVSELLGNLIYSILFILVVYLPPLVLAIILCCKHIFIVHSLRRRLRQVGAIAVVLGLAACCSAYLSNKKYGVSRDLFPVNVCCNIVKAIERTAQTASYPLTSADFRFDATHVPADSAAREIYVLVVGETSRADRWQLLGAQRSTNPRLSRRTDVIPFPKALTQSNTTHKSVPMMLSHVTAENFDSILHSKSILSAFSEAGFRTAFFSNQQPNRSITEFFSHQADTTVYTEFNIGQLHPYDSELIDLLRHEIADTTNRRLFVVLHTYGSHFTYRDRYPDSFSRFTPDCVVDANKANIQSLLNAYDNSIVFTDFILDSVIAALEESGAKSAMLYAADHGEDIFDDDRNRFLHASPTPTYYQLHVAAVAWLSPHTAHQQLREIIRGNSSRLMSPSVQLFHTMLDIADVSTPFFDASASLASSRFISPQPLYLTDHNVGVPLNESGVKKHDIELLQEILEK